MSEEKETDYIMGIGDDIELAQGIKKKLRVGTIKQIKDVSELFKDKLMKIKHAIQQDDEKKSEEQIKKWIEILNIVLIEGLTREEFDNSIPEAMENAVDRFLFS